MSSAAIKHCVPCFLQIYCLKGALTSMKPPWSCNVAPKIQGRILLLTICAAGIGGTFQFGYNLSIINAPTSHIQEFTNETWQARTGEPLPDYLILLMWSLIVSLYPLGGLFGALLAGPLAITLGSLSVSLPPRKKSLLVNNIFVVLAAILFGFSRKAGSFEMIMLGRLLVGVSAALRRLRGSGDLARELEELEEERAACQGCRARRPWELFQHRALRRQVTSLVVLGSAMELCGNDLMYAYASSVFQKAGVPEAKVQYATIGTGSCELLMAIVSLSQETPSHCLPHTSGTMAGCMGLRFLPLKCVAVERMGRRVLLIGGYSLMACWGSIFTVALCLQVAGVDEGWRVQARLTSTSPLPRPRQSSFPWTLYLAVACIFASILSFGIGPAGVTGILATELFDQMARPAACMVCGALMWIMLFLVSLGFPFIMEALSHFLYVPFLGVCVCGAIYTGLFLPETKGKTLQEISEELHRLNFPRRAQGPMWRSPEVIQSTEL
ncbi:solute carrier family 2, facilitated glucose transporter member 11 isoform X16 [Chlorocebus sabaeus]|uniref:solute carrier family 2, facilitated glucose transporter member 11 isoform X16 n=1 Tax=Chlorocebus sabaeus TaxID=60711 RepID=UPI003BF9D065